MFYFNRVAVSNFKIWHWSCVWPFIIYCKTWGRNSERTWLSRRDRVHNPPSRMDLFHNLHPSCGASSWTNQIEAVYMSSSRCYHYNACSLSPTHCIGGGGCKLDPVVAYPLVDWNFLCFLGPLFSQSSLYYGKNPVSRELVSVWITLWQIQFL